MKKGRNIFKLIIFLVFLFCIAMVIVRICGTFAFHSDAVYLVEQVEEIHPEFILDDIPDGYSDAREKFLKDTSVKMKWKDFNKYIIKYLASLGDGHTSVSGENDHKYLKVSWHSMNKTHLYLLDEEGKLTNEEVIRIGNVETVKILQTVDYYFPVENNADCDQNYSLWSRADYILEEAGCEINNSKVAIVLLNGNQEKTETLELSNINIEEFYSYNISSSLTLVDEDIIYIDLNRCDMDDKIKKVISELEEKVAEGFSSIIIDVRDNPGGNSQVDDALLKAMGMEPPSYGVFIRYSDIIINDWGWKSDLPGEEYLKRDMDCTKKNPNINLVILTNENTFSAATMLGVLVQDGNLGIIMGQTSVNAPSNYGDILSVKLPKSRYIVYISCKKFLRPDESASQDALIPDIGINYNEDALQAAINYFHNQ